MHPAHDQKEVTPYSVGMGLLMPVIFLGGSRLFGLRVGQVFEAAIPLSIIAVGLSNALGKKKIPSDRTSVIQKYRACSGVIVAGARFHSSGFVHPSGQVFRT